MGTPHATIKSILLLAIFSLLNWKCGESPTSTSGGTPPPTTTFSIGEIANYTLGGLTQQIVDPVSGCTFRSDRNQGDSLRIATVTSGPAISFSGKQFYLDYTGSDTLRMTAVKTPGTSVVLFEYAVMENAAIDKASNTQWWEFPAATETDTLVTFAIVMPTKTSLAKGLRISRSASYFSINNVPNNSSDGMKMDSIKASIEQCIALWLYDLPSSLKTSAQTSIRGDLKYDVRWSNDGAAYVHNNSFFRCNAVLYFDKFTTIEDVSHEVGHYMTHVLTGYTRYQDIYSRFPTDIWGAGIVHAFGDYRNGRKDLLEDYAYFSTYFTTGFFQSNDLSRPNIYALFSGKSPEDIDFPSQEGFGSVLIASLMRKEATTYGYDKKIISVPIVNASRSDVLNILAKGPRNVTELLNEIQSYLQQKGSSYSDKLGSMVEPLGWSYHGFGYLVDKAGAPLVGAEVACVAQAGAETFITMRGTPSGSAGKYYIPKLYPGTSMLRVYYNAGKDSLDFPLTIDWSQETSTAVDLGTLVVAVDEAKITIKSITPKSGKPGDQITIVGKGFGDMFWNKPTALFADSVEGKIVSITNDTLMKVKVPIVKVSNRSPISFKIKLKTDLSRRDTFTIDPVSFDCFVNFVGGFSLYMKRQLMDSIDNPIKDTIYSMEYVNQPATKFSVSGNSLTLTNSVMMVSSNYSYLSELTLECDFAGGNSTKLHAKWWTYGAHTTVDFTTTQTSRIMFTNSGVQFYNVALKDGTFSGVRGLDMFFYDRSDLIGGGAYLNGSIW